METVGDRIRTARERAGYSQRELAVMVHWERTLVARYERKLVPDPRGSTLIKLARALEVSTDYLLGLTDDPHARG